MPATFNPNLPKSFQYDLVLDFSAKTTLGTFQTLTINAGMDIQRKEIFNRIISTSKHLGTTAILFGETYGKVNINDIIVNPISTLYEATGPAAIKGLFNPFTMTDDVNEQERVAKNILSTIRWSIFSKETPEWQKEVTKAIHIVQKTPEPCLRDVINILGQSPKPHIVKKVQELNEFINTTFYNYQAFLENGIPLKNFIKENCINHIMPQTDLSDNEAYSVLVKYSVLESLNFFFQEKTNSSPYLVAIDAFSFENMLPMSAIVKLLQNAQTYKTSVVVTNTNIPSDTQLDYTDMLLLLRSSRITIRACERENFPPLNKNLLRALKAKMPDEHFLLVRHSEEVNTVYLKTNF